MTGHTVSGSDKARKVVYRSDRPVVLMRLPAPAWCIMLSMRSCRAFSIIELLVVVSLLALLVAMLLPTLSIAREAGRRAVCATRVQTFIEYVLTEANDDDGRLPDLHNDSGQKWGSQTYNDFGGPNPHTFDIDARDAVMADLGIERDQFYCPSNNGKLWNRDDFWVHNGGARSVWGYVYYGAAPVGHSVWSYLDGNGKPTFANRVSDQPVYDVLWSDMNREVSPHSWYRFDVAQGSNHFNEPTFEPMGSNVGRVDGSVAWTTWDDMRDHMRRSGWAFWW